MTADNAGGICAPINIGPVDSGAPVVDTGAPVDAGETDASADVSDAAPAETGETDAGADGATDTTEDTSIDVSTEAAPAETAAD
ncbi:MAG TPA: hypothetical protein VGL59_08185 [Polyangia bacterium]